MTHTVLYSAEAISERVATLAKDITADLGKDFTIIALLRGSFVFAADLMRTLAKEGADPEIEFMKLSSYGNATESSGTVTVMQDLPIPEAIKGRKVLIIDDILDSGRTMLTAKKMLHDVGAETIRSAVLLDKPARRAVDVATDFVAFPDVPNVYVAGYGLDFEGKLRGLPNIVAVES